MSSSTKTTTTKRGPKASNSSVQSRAKSPPKVNDLGREIDDASSLSPSDSASETHSRLSRASASPTDAESEAGDSDGAKSSKDSDSAEASRKWTRTTEIMVPTGKDVEVRIRYGRSGP